MNFAESFRIALRALLANKARSLLTMLGVIIGVSAVILLVAIGTGVQQEITGQIEGLGSNLLFVFPGDYSGGQGMGGGGGGMGGGAVTVQKRFRMEDADLLRRRLGGEALVVPVVQGSASLRAGNRTWRATIAGADQEGDQVFNANYVSGRHYNRGEYLAAARVLMLGATPADKLFPGQDPVGREVIVNGSRFTVIGLMGAQGGGLSGSQDNQIYMPATTAQRLLGSNDLSIIVVKSNDPARVDAVKRDVQMALRPGFHSDFTVFTQAQTLGILDTLLGTLTVMLAGLASISLLVGGIGIMNIMLVSVSERTREIGIRKAVGARTYDILSQFVIEAVMLSVMGGLLGIALGGLGAIALDPVLPTAITPWAVALAFFFSAAVGVFFGVYPAWKASKLDPIVALRYE